jgi:chaperonin GroEL
LKLEKATLADLGRARRIEIDKDSTPLIGSAGDPGRIAERIAEVRHAIDESTSDYDRDQMRERAARLSGGIALFKDAASTEMEMKEKRSRVEDALHATRAAVEEGIVPGGGVALLRAQATLGDLEGKLDEEQRAGLNIVRRAVEEPLRMISQNAGIDGSIVIEKVKNAKGAFGFNAATEEYEDLVKAGVIDPTKVVRSALQNAASVASLLLTTEAMIAEKPKEEGHSHGGAGGMGGMGGMPPM